MAKKGSDGTVYRRSSGGYSREAVRDIHSRMPVSGDPNELRRINTQVNQAWESRRNVHRKK